MYIWVLNSVPNSFSTNALSYACIYGCPMQATVLLILIACHKGCIYLCVELNAQVGGGPDLSIPFCCCRNTYMCTGGIDTRIMKDIYIYIVVWGWADVSIMLIQHI